MQSETMSLFFNEKKLHDMVTAAMAEHWPTIKLHLHSIETAIRHIVMDGQSDGSFGPTTRTRRPSSFIRP